MEKKEFHRGNLPHFQQPGQAYFVTWNLKDAIPPIALRDYSQKLASARCLLDLAIQQNVSLEEINKLRFDYYHIRKKIMKAYEDLLHLENKSSVNLAKEENINIIHTALRFWEGKKLENFAICVMPNHVHWVFQLFEKNETDKLVWLQDILKSVKGFSAKEINLLENRKGTLWHKESWDTTIRDHRHLYEAIEYTKNNPVVAGLVRNAEDWRGTLIF